MPRRTLLAATLAALVLFVPLALGLPGATAPAGAQDTTDETPVPEHDIIPRPNSGRAPSDAGDRGGVLQGLVFVVIVTGVGTIVALGVRESRRNRRSRV